MASRAFRTGAAVRRNALTLIAPYGLKSYWIGVVSAVIS
jgi:hypothetical protein